MRPKLLSIISIIIFSIVIIPGCSFKIINTDGMQLAFQDIDRASDYASELKAMKDIPQTDFYRAKDSYIAAKNVLNGYLAKAITDASDYEVNNTKEEYLATGATAKVDAFEKEVKSLRPTPKLGFGLPSAAVISPSMPVAKEAIKAIMEANEKTKDKGLNLYTTSVEKYKMKSFEDIPVGKVVVK